MITNSARFSINEHLFIFYHGFSYLSRGKYNFTNLFSTMSIDVNHFPSKKDKRSVWHCDWWALETEPGGRRRKSPPIAAAHCATRCSLSLSVSSSLGLLSFRVRMGLLLLQIKCCANFWLRSSTLRNVSQS